MTQHTPAPITGDASDGLVRDIVRGLYDGRYVAGQRLVEPDLMAQYGLGRSTVREALKRLAAEGVVSIAPFRGARIRHLSPKEAGDVLAILEVIVGLAARLGAQAVAQAVAAQDQSGGQNGGQVDTDSPVARFRQRSADLAAFEDGRDSYDLVRARNRFYRAMVQLGDNPDLERLLMGFQVHLIRSQLKQPQDRRFDDYRLMAAAILAGDAPAAEAAARDHIRDLIRALAKDSG